MIKFAFIFLAILNFPFASFADEYDFVVGAQCDSKNNQLILRPAIQYSGMEPDFAPLAPGEEKIDVPVSLKGVNCTFNNGTKVSAQTVNDIFSRYYFSGLYINGSEILHYFQLLDLRYVSRNVTSMRVTDSILTICGYDGDFEQFPDATKITCHDSKVEDLALATQLAEAERLAKEKAQRSPLCDDLKYKPYEMKKMGDVSYAVMDLYGEGKDVLVASLHRTEGIYDVTTIVVSDSTKNIEEQLKEMHGKPLRELAETKGWKTFRGSDFPNYTGEHMGRKYASFELLESTHGILFSVNSYEILGRDGNVIGKPSRINGKVRIDRWC